MENPYDMELPRLLAEIRKQEPKVVCLQLADGLKPFAKEITDAIKAEFPAVRVVIWGGSNFGACDNPVGLNNLKVDLLFSFGHSPWVWGDELKRFG